MDYAVKENACYGGGKQEKHTVDANDLTHLEGRYNGKSVLKGNERTGIGSGQVEK